MAVPADVSSGNTILAAYINSILDYIESGHIHDGTDGGSTLGGTVGVTLTKLLNRKKKTADTTRNSTTTFADDTHLAGWTADASSYYAIQGYLIVNAAATPDLKIQLEVPAGASYNIKLIDAATIAAAWTGSYVHAGTAADVAISFIGVITIAGTAGVIDLQWAQNTSDAGNTTIKAGSWIEIIKL